MVTCRVTVWLALVAGAVACTPPSSRIPPMPEYATVCDMQRWQEQRPPAPWSDSLVAEDKLDTALVRLSTPPLRNGPPPEGWAIVGFVVMPEGRVADAAVVLSSSRVVDSLAVLLVGGSRYSTPRSGGRPAWAFACAPVVLTIFRG